MDSVTRRFENWDKQGSLVFDASYYGKDILGAFVSQLDASIYHCFWLEKQVVLEDSYGRTVGRAVPHLYIECVKR